MSENNWYGSEECQICGTSCSVEGQLFDARLKKGRYAGRWAVLCRSCAEMEEVTLGVGCGQKYAWNAERERFQRVDG